MLYPDEIFSAYIRPKYEPYRLALPDPTVLPPDADIIWDTFLGGIKDTAIMFTCDYEDPTGSFLGGGRINWDASVTVYVMFLYLGEGKPAKGKEFAKFFEKYLIVTQPVNELKTAGIQEFKPTRLVVSQGPPPFRSLGPITQGVQNPQTDLWSLYTNLAVKYIQAANAPP